MRCLWVDVDLTFSFLKLADRGVFGGCHRPTEFTSVDGLILHYRPAAFKTAPAEFYSVERMIPPRHDRVSIIGATE